MRTRRFTFDSLEPRQLMASGFAKLMRSAPVQVATLDMPPIGPPMPPKPTNLPSVTITGGSPNSIGGSVGVLVTPNNAYKMTKIVYSTSGAIATQSFGLDKGDYTSYSGTTHQYATGVSQDMQSFFWNASEGSRTVTVTVTYDDPAHTVLTGTASINIQKPTVIGTTIKGKKPRVGILTPDPADNRFGITNYASNGSHTVEISSVIGDRPSGCQVGYVQIATKLDATWENGTAITTITSPPGMRLVDVLPGQDDVAMNDFWTAINPGAGSIQIASRTDAPSVFATMNGAFNPAGAATKMMMDFAFDTYLVYKPNGGLYVAIDHVAWTLNATATYKGPALGPNSQADYLNPANWTITSTPSGDWEKTGDLTVSLLNWTGNTPQNTPPAITSPKLP